MATLFGLVRLEPAPMMANQAGSSTTLDATNNSPQSVHLVADSSRTFTDDEQNNISIYETYSSAVVNISSEKVYYSFFEAIPQEGATGSGSIIDARGYILTNNHVIKNSSRLFVTLSSGDKLEAKIVGVDPENDLAVIKIDPGNRTLKTIDLGTSSNLKVGQKILAIGNPFSFNWTLTTGVVSGLGRPIRSDNNLVIQNMIQTDAAINSGNSGGPLLDSKGRMIGINTMIFSPSGGSVGIGFSVPVDTAKRVVPELISTGKVRRGWIELSPIQLFPELVRYARLQISQGVLVSRIRSGGNADRAGLRAGNRQNAVNYGRTVIYLGGDIIVEVDGTAILGIASLYEALEDNKPGQTITIVYYRDNKKYETTVTLSERPADYLVD